MEIPVINVLEENAYKKLHEAFITVGFAYIETITNIHHIKSNTVPGRVLNILEYSKKFFSLPIEEKNKIKYNSTESNVGYQGMIESLTPGTPVDLKEAFNWCEHRDDNLWYDEEQKNRCMAWSWQMRKLANRVLLMIEDALNIERFELVRKHYRSKSTTSRLLHYPVWNDSIEENQMRGGEHTDYGTVTILITDENAGLQIKPRGQDWIDAPYIEGTYIVNVGDLLQRWTNDLYMSTPHRVVNSNLDCSRYSFPYFVHPDDNVIVDSLIGEAKYEPITAKEYLVWRLNQSY